MLKEKYNRDFIWVTKDGKECKIKDLSDEHLFKLLAYVEQRKIVCLPFRQKYENFDSFLKEEIEYRKKVEEFYKTMGRSLYLRPSIYLEEKPISVKMKKIAELLGLYLFKPNELQLKEYYKWNS